MQQKHNLSAELAKAIATRMKQIESMPEKELHIIEQKKEFESIEKESSLKLNQDMLTICQRIEENKKVLD